MGINTAFSIVGLSLDMIGVIIIFLFGISPKLDIEGQTNRVTGEINNDEVCKAKCYRYLSWTGLFLVFFGFFMQLLGQLTK
ncbi:hypothetical protein DSECCO2_244200 [anaerobic digester metagenome]